MNKALEKARELLLHYGHVRAAVEAYLNDK